MPCVTDLQQDWTDDRPATHARAFELATTALRVRPDLPEAHRALAVVHVQARQHDKALAWLDDGLRLNASYAEAYALAAYAMSEPGQRQRLLDALVELGL